MSIIPNIYVSNYTFLHILTLVYRQEVIAVKYSDAQKDATARYNKKAYDRINIIVKKGQRQRIKEFAAKHGKSLNRFVCDLIEAEMNKGETE